MSQSSVGAAYSNKPTSADEFGLVVNVFNTIQFAHALVLAPAIGYYASSRPNQGAIKELKDILRSWEKTLKGFKPEQRAQFEIDHPGEFDSMMESIDECVLLHATHRDYACLALTRAIRASRYKGRLDDLKVDLRHNPWARYLPLVNSELSREFSELSERIKALDSDYYVGSLALHTITQLVLMILRLQLKSIGRETEGVQPNRLR